MGLVNIVHVMTEHSVQTVTVSVMVEMLVQQLVSLVSFVMIPARRVVMPVVMEQAILLVPVVMVVLPVTQTVIILVMAVTLHATETVTADVMALIPVKVM